MSLTLSLSRVKFLNCRKFGELRPYFINKKDNYTWVHLLSKLKMVRWWSIPLKKQI